MGDLTGMEESRYCMVILRISAIGGIIRYQQQKGVLK